MTRRKGRHSIQLAIKNAMKDIAKVGERKPIYLKVVEDDYQPVLNITSELGHVQCTEEVFTKALKLLGYDV
jgi:hypothetical protein